MAKGPTVYDVAQEAGVSIATVSFTFRQPDRVRPATREAVLSAARSLGYVPSASARGLARGRTGALGLFAFDYLIDSTAVAAGRSDVESPAEDPNESYRIFPLYVDEIQRGVQLECWKRGYALMVGGGNPNTTETTLTDIAGRVDGLAVFPNSLPQAILERISQRIPVVEVSETLLNRELDHVTVDNFGGMRSLVRHLVDVHQLTDLQFVGGLTSSDNRARWSGMAATLTQYGLTPRPLAQEGEFSREDIGNLVSSLHAAGALPQAFVCATDEEALKTLDALKDAGIAVPGTVAVTGFDGIVAGKIARPALTTVRQPMEEMGRAIVGLLINRIENPEQAPVAQELPVRLVVRESCGCSAP